MISRAKQLLLFIFFLVILVAATHYGYKGLLWLNDWMNKVDEQRQRSSRIRWLVHFVYYIISLVNESIKCIKFWYALNAYGTRHSTYITFFYHGTENNHPIDTFSDFSWMRFSFGGSINLYVQYCYQRCSYLYN